MKKTGLKDNLRKILKIKNTKASFTVEAAVVVPICMVIIVSAVMTVLYFHDSVALQAAAASIVPAKYLQYEEDENVYVNEAKTYFSRRLIVLKNAISKSIEEKEKIKVDNTGDFSVSLGIAGDILESILGDITVRMEIKSLNARENLIKYKALCDGMENIGFDEGEKE